MYVTSSPLRRSAIKMLVVPLCVPMLSVGVAPKGIKTRAPAAIAEAAVMAEAIVG